MPRSIRSSAVAVACLALLAAGLGACGSDEKTVVVNPSQGSTTVVSPSGTTKVCPAGRTVC